MVTAAGPAPVGLYITREGRFKTKLRISYDFAQPRFLAFDRSPSHPQLGILAVGVFGLAALPPLDDGLDDSLR